MYQIIRNEVPGFDSTNKHSDADPMNSNNGNSNNGNSNNGEPLEVCWLPSLPLTKKHKAPQISGLGIFYSEELEKVLHVFETDNLKEGINTNSRDQAAALNIDPTCRLHWMEIANPARRAYSRLKLLTQIKAA